MVEYLGIIYQVKITRNIKIKELVIDSGNNLKITFVGIDFDFYIKHDNLMSGNTFVKLEVDQDEYNWDDFNNEIDGTIEEPNRRRRRPTRASKARRWCVQDKKTSGRTDI